MPPACRLDIESHDGPVGSFHHQFDFEAMIEVLAGGDADFLAMASPFIREPDDLARKPEAGHTGAMACVSVTCAWHTTASVRCAAGRTRIKDAATPRGSYSGCIVWSSVEEGVG